MDTPIGPNPNPVIPSSQAQRPQNLREEAALEERGASRGALSSRTTHRRSVGRSRGPAPTGPSWRTAGESQVPFELRSRLRPPPTPEFRGLHLKPRDPPTTPRAGPAAFHPHFSRAGDGKHEPTNRAAPRTRCTQWGLVGGTAVHQSELSRCGARCPKRGSSRLASPGPFSPIKWFRGPLSLGTAPLLGWFWPLRETVQ